MNGESTNGQNEQESEKEKEEDVEEEVKTVKMFYLGSAISQMIVKNSQNLSLGLIICLLIRLIFFQTISFWETLTKCKPKPVSPMLMAFFIFYFSVVRRNV